MKRIMQLISFSFFFFKAKFNFSCNLSLHGEKNKTDKLLKVRSGCRDLISKLFGYNSIDNWRLILATNSS